MKLIKKLVRGYVVGVFVGLFISMIFNLYYGNKIYLATNPEMLSRFGDNQIIMIFVATIIWGLIGVLFTLAADIFTIEYWSLTHATLVHFSLTYILLWPLTVMAGWISINIKNLEIYTVIFVVVYLTFWISKMAYYQDLVKKLNDRM